MQAGMQELQSQKAQPQIYSQIQCLSKTDTPTALLLLLVPF